MSILDSAAEQPDEADERASAVEGVEPLRGATPTAHRPFAAYPGVMPTLERRHGAK
jgi:hypothetical protein